MSSTTTIGAGCPRCLGQPLPAPAGPIDLKHRANCPLLYAEDATRAADHARGRTFTRQPTPVETQLIEALGLPPTPWVRVQWVSRGYRVRTPTTEPPRQGWAT